MASYFRLDSKVKNDTSELIYSQKEKNPSYLNTRMKGIVYQKLQKVKSIKRDISYDINSKRTEKNLFYDNKKAVNDKASKENSRIEPIKKEEYISNSEKKLLQPLRNNQSNKPNFLRSHNNRKNLLKNSYILDSKGTSPFSSNTSNNRINNTSPYLITNNNNHSNLSANIIERKNITNISRDSKNVKGLIEDKKEQKRSTSFNIQNIRNPKIDVNTHERINSWEINLDTKIDKSQNDRIKQNISKMNSIEVLNIVSLIKPDSVKRANTKAGNMNSTKKQLQSNIFNIKFQNIIKQIDNKKEIVIVEDNRNFNDIKRSKKNILLSNNKSKDLSEIEKLKDKKIKSSSNLKQIESSKNKFLNENKYLLTDFHLEELKNIPDVFFFKETKLFEDENIFDDDKGWFIIRIGNHIFYRYEIVKELGRGSFGQAIKCYDHKRKKYVCVKIIKNRTKIHNQSKREISILEYISKENKDGSANIIEILSYFNFRNHMCIVFELLELTLYDLLKLNKFNGVSLDELKVICYQILKTLDFLHVHRIIHCDLKPENILLKSKDINSLKIIDFGSSCFEDKKLYNYIQSRYYRAPEVILGYEYGIEIDLWSFGCIVVELYSGYPIFSGQDERDQLNYMMEYLGIPPVNYLEKSRRKNKFFNENNEPLLYRNSKGKKRRPNTKKLTKFLGSNDERLISFIESFLVWEPHRRLVPKAALQHIFLRDICKNKNFK